MRPAQELIHVPAAARALVLAMALAPGAVLARSPAAHLAVPGGTLTIRQAGAATTATLTRRHRVQEIRLPPDAETIITAGTFQYATTLAALGRSVVVLTTTYASQTGRGGPQARCAAGQEVVLRVIRLHPSPRQTFRLLVESCWVGVYHTPVTWDAATAAIRLGDGAGSIDAEIPPYRVGADGTVTPVTVTPVTVTPVTVTPGTVTPGPIPR